MSTHSSRSEIQNELSRRLLDLALRCEKNSCVTNSSFLTPAECLDAEKIRLPSDDVKLFLSGGHPECERKIAFFLPFFLSREDLDIQEAIKPVRIRSFFGKPGHRDYLGAILGLGIERNRIGDVLISNDTAVVFCMASVVPLLLRELSKVGRCSVKTEQISLSDISFPERKTRTRDFTVKSLRLDAVAGNMFGVSRSTAAELIRLGAVSLNYTVCEEPDAQIKANDIISVHGKGKGKITDIGGRSKKDRLFVEAEIYLN
ncbi:MAG: hypothetical protein ILP14_13870 [Oscillospiraceae bacterium]|nr:hypothetical protein [Oscillospiraceae bacterium]